MLSTTMHKIVHYFKKWSEDYNAAQKELNDMGLYTAFSQWGSYVHYIDPTLNTQINTTDDKLEAVSTDNRKSKEPRQI